MGGRPSVSARSGVIGTQISPRACVDHEVDHIRCDLRRRANQIALVFTVLIVGDNDQLAVTNVLNCVFHAIEWH